MRQRRIDSFELISETRRTRIEICCRCPIHVQAAHALHLGMVKDLKRLPPEDPEKSPTPRRPPQSMEFADDPPIFSLWFHPLSADGFFQLPQTTP